MSDADLRYIRPSKFVAAKEALYGYDSELDMLRVRLGATLEVLDALCVVHVMPGQEYSLQGIDLKDRRRCPK